MRGKRFQRTHVIAKKSTEEQLKMMQDFLINHSFVKVSKAIIDCDVYEFIKLASEKEINLVEESDTIMVFSSDKTSQENVCEE